MSLYLCQDSRRLTGANLYSERSGAVLDLLISDEISGDSNIKNLSSITDSWLSNAKLFLQALSWPEEDTFFRTYENGVSLGVTAPIDCLYSAVDLCEAALLLSAAELELGSIEGIELELEADRQKLLQHLQTITSEEKSSKLLDLQSAASAEHAVFLYDDDMVSVGLGKGCQQWPIDHVPEPEKLNWSEISSVPVALITGTNGKSTSIRLAAAIAQAAGLSVGTTSTDFIKINDLIVDEGDYSGPGGARTILRDKRVEIAYLELARGGLLRRGLGVPTADAALITNVAADHLGDYGINTVAELIEAKFIVHRALTPQQPLVLNADDKGVVNHVKSFDQNIIWFSENKDLSLLREHIENGGEAVTIDEEKIVHIKHGKSTEVVLVEEIPITLNGMARHNVQNALGVVALSCTMGIDYRFIKSGLVNFKGKVEENPGRGNFFEAKGVKILIDFAHNEHGMRALAATAANIESKRRLILMGQAGDRSDAAIVDLVNAAMKAAPDQMVVSETPGYERGREINEISEVIVKAIKAFGFNEQNIMRTSNPVEGVKKALEWALPGDFLLFFILTNRKEAIEIVEEYISS